MGVALLAYQAGPLQGPAPVQVLSLSGWMSWVLIVAALVLVLLMLAGNRNRRGPRRT